MIDINPKPSEDLPISPPPEDATPEIEQDIEDPDTLIVAPPSLRERIQSAQRARTLQIQPSVELPDSAAEAENKSE
jgi:hypothetical protein